MLIGRDMARFLDPVLFAFDAGIICDPWQANLLRQMPRRALLNCSRQSGKSTTCAIMALHVGCFEPDSLIVCVAPSQRQSAELLRSIRILHGKVDGVPALDGESVLKLELANGSRIMALPGGEEGKTIRGLAGCRLLLVDEAARIDDNLMQACRPMLATNARGSLIMLSTPAGKRGTWFDLWHNNDPIWTRIRVPASECPRISQEWLDEELRTLGPTRFSEEYGLEFVDNVMAAFNSALIDALFDDHSVRELWT
jgi:hypothetical protein